MAMDKKKLAGQLVLIFAVIGFFALMNLSLYNYITRRLGNNFGGADSAKMIDVSRYLPFEEASDIVRIDSTFKLEGELPVLDGAAALVPVYAAFIDNVYPEGSVTYEGGAFSDDNFYGENFAADSKMQYKNSVRGFDAVVDGTTDIFLCAMPSDAQKKSAEEKKVELEYVPIGLEAFVFFVNCNNPVDNLSCEDIRKIYDGSAEKWSEFGGTDDYINPVTRLAGSGSQNAMDRFMKDRPIADKSFMGCFGKAIGYSFRYYLCDLVGDSEVKMISLNGVYPDRENIRNRTYPVVSEFYAAYRKDNDNPNVKRLIDWILSGEGQTIIDKTGYVSLK